MKSLLLLVLSLVFAVSARADALGESVEVTPTEGWIRIAPGQTSPFPTLRYVPKDGRNATVLFSAVPKDLAKVTDPASLKKFHRVLQQPYLAGPDEEVTLTEFKVPQGFGVYAVFEDPDLVANRSEKAATRSQRPLRFI